MKVRTFTHAPQRAGRTYPARRDHKDIAPKNPGIAKPLRTIFLELTPSEAAALVALLSRWPSRSLAATTGHSRATLRRWYLRMAWQVKRQGIEQHDECQAREGRALPRD
nr:hypothetical protein [Armatimonas sp.]